MVEFRIGEVVLEAASRDDTDRLVRLMELNLHDFSEIRGTAPGEDGRFGADLAPGFWDDPKRFAFLIRAGGALAGFSLAHRCEPLAGASGEVMDVGEFFVARGFRRRGVGRAAARALLARFPGEWQIRVMTSNAGALPFWEAVVAEACGGSGQRFRKEVGGEDWVVHRFSLA